jgi:tripartite-type tricarboxylate transporter receptor subunit TctC
MRPAAGLAFLRGRIGKATLASTTRSGAPMTLPRRTLLRLSAGLLASATLPRVARAQSYPTRPITIVVPYPPGGPTDTIARLIAERMRASLGQPMVIENVSGGGGTIGVTRVARAPGDGYTLSIGHWGSHVINGAVYTLPFDLLTDLEPVALIADGPQLVIAAKTVPANDIKELIAWLKANPGKGMVGTTGVGGASNLAAILFAKMTGTEIQIVPYRGSAPRMQDLLSGQIHLAFDQASSALAQVQGGNLRGYAVTSRQRLAVAPGIPTVDEAGLPGFYMSVWHGLWAPKGTPKDVIARLNAAVVDALGDATVRARLTDLGQELPAREQLTPQALGAYQKAEIEKWWPIVKAAGIKVE